MSTALRTCLVLLVIGALAAVVHAQAFPDHELTGRRISLNQSYTGHRVKVRYRFLANLPENESLELTGRRTRVTTPRMTRRSAHAGLTDRRIYFKPKLLKNRCDLEQEYSGRRVAHPETLSGKRVYYKVTFTRHFPTPRDER
jgi:hypothetical protein